MERLPHDAYTVKVDGTGHLSQRTRMHLRPFQALDMDDPLDLRSDFAWTRGPPAAAAARPQSRPVNIPRPHGDFTPRPLAMRARRINLSDEDIMRAKRPPTPPPMAMDLSLPESESVLEESFGTNSGASDDTVVMTTPPETPPPPSTPTNEAEGGDAAPAGAAEQNVDDNVGLRRSARTRRPPVRYAEVATMTEEECVRNANSCGLQ